MNKQQCSYDIVSLAKIEIVMPSYSEYISVEEVIRDYLSKLNINYCDFWYNYNEKRCVFTFEFDEDHILFMLHFGHMS